MIASYFCLIPGTDLAFVTISKNAVTFLKGVAVHQRDGIWLNDVRQIHDRIGYKADSEFLVPVAEMGRFEKAHGVRRKFAVWRDPVARLESTFSLFVRGDMPHPYFDYLGLPADPRWDRFMEFLAFECSKPHVEAIDEHVRRQVDYYGLADVDDVVVLDRLQDYLTAHGVTIRHQRVNRSAADFTVPDDESLAWIHHHYASDYRLLDSAGNSWT